MFSMDFFDNFSLSLVLSLSLFYARARARALSLSLRPSLRCTGAHTLSHILHPIITRARALAPPCHMGGFKRLRANTRLTERKSSATVNMTAACNILVTILFLTPAHRDRHTHQRATHMNK